MPLEVRSRSRAPSYSKEDYPYIQRGFILPNFKLFDAIDTYFIPNNETMNCYTQLAGLIVFIFMFLTVTLAPETSLINPEEYTNTSHTEIVKRKNYFQFALGCIIACCLASLITHTFQAQNRRWHDFLAVCDWGGTLVIAMGTCIAMDLGADFGQIIEHHISDYSKTLGEILIWCTGPQHLTIACTAFALTLGVLAFASTGNSSHAFRFGIIATAMITSLLPGIVLLFWLRPIKSFIALCSIFAGGFFFGSHYPEKKFSRTFDICCPSHCLWHTGYICSLIMVYDTVAILFFGQSPYTWENCMYTLKWLMQCVVLAVA